MQHKPNKQSAVSYGTPRSLGLGGISECTKATHGSINHGWSNLRRVGVGWPLDGCAAVSAHMQMLLYTVGFGSREVLRQLRWWLGLLWSEPVWSKKHFVLLKRRVIIMCCTGGFVNGRVIAERLLLSLSFSRAQQAWSLSACRCWWL